MRRREYARQLVLAEPVELPADDEGGACWYSIDTPVEVVGPPQHIGYLIRLPNGREVDVRPEVIRRRGGARRKGPA